MTETRSLILLNEMGDLEINWSEESDDRMREIIAKKMKEGVRFFQMKTMLGGRIAYKQQLRNRTGKIADMRRHIMSHICGQVRPYYLRQASGLIPRAEPPDDVPFVPELMAG